MVESMILTIYIERKNIMINKIFYDLTFQSVSYYN